MKNISNKSAGEYAFWEMGRTVCFFVETGRKRGQTDMIKIGLCDDDVQVLDELQTLLDRYCGERDQEIDYMAFQSPLDLMADIERGAQFDILILDVLMPGENGIDAAEEVRSYDRSVKIIFLTSSSEYAVESYRVGAYYYQLKPIRAEGLFRLLDSALDDCEKERGRSLILRCKSGITRVKLRQLEFCEVIHRTLLLHLTNGTVLESAGSLDELYRQLMPFGGFLRPHRSYIVNLDYVQTLSARAIIMSGQAEIPLPRGKHNEVKNAFLAHAFQNRQVIL